jgi:hypothetical protein
MQPGKARTHIASTIGRIKVIWFKNCGQAGLAYKVLQNYNGLMPKAQITLSTFVTLG